MGEVLDGEENESSEEEGEDGSDEEQENTNDKYDPPSIQDYLSNLNPEEDEDMEVAIEWLREFTDGEDGKGKVVENDSNAKSIVDQLSSECRRNALDILLEHVHLDFQATTASKKDLVSWLKRPNNFRNYFFYKASALKELVEKRGVTVTGRSTKDAKIQALIDADIQNNCRVVQPHDEAMRGNQDNEERQQRSLKNEAIKKILQKSFLPHQKGAAREHCSLGHRLEKPILKNWIKLSSNDIEFPVPGLEVRGAYAAGLAAKKGALYAKDSIDFILVVQNNLAEEDDELECWGFEAKGRVTSRTAIDEEESLSSLFFNKTIRIDDCEVVDLVRTEAERFQVLQHAFVYNFKTVVIAISDAQSEIIRSVIIDFSEELRSHFGKVLKEMNEFSLSWMYNYFDEVQSSGRARMQRVVHIPQNISSVASTIPNINGEETLQGTVNLYASLAMLPRPFPSLTRLIPAIYAFWNAVKGGSDTTTKLMDKCAMFIPHTNCETVASTRCIMLLFVTCHRLFQLIGSNIDLNQYSSLYHYRNASSKRTTFHHTLLACNHIFKNELKRIESEKEQRNSNVSENNENISPPQRRARANRRRYNGVLPEEATFAPSLPFLTPKKITRNVQNGEAPSLIEEMVTKCTGMPMKNFNATQQRCDICTSKTNWYCIGCKRWLCVERRNTKDNKKPMKLYNHTVRGKSTLFQKQCFHIAHETSWCNHANHINLVDADA